MAAESLRARLRRHDDVVLVNPDWISPGLIEFLAAAGADALMLDMEQGVPDFRDVDELARVARGVGLPVLVRVFSAEAWVLERTLLRGVDGLVIPRQNDPALIRWLVDEVEYVLQGTASKVCLVVQIEDRAAVERLDDFLRIDRVDSFFIGPVDLSKSLGHRGIWREGPMRPFLEDLVARVARSGKNCGMLVASGDVAAWRAAGARLFYTHAYDFLRDGLADFRARIKVDGAR